MNEQAADLLEQAEIIRRYKTLVGLLAMLGLLGGAVFAALNPPVFTSQALVGATSCPNGAICGGPLFAGSYLPSVVPKTVPAPVRVSDGVVSVSGTGRTAAQAEAAADVAARRYIAYAASVVYDGQHPSPSLLQPAMTVTGLTWRQELLRDILLGAVFGVATGVAAAQAGSQNVIAPSAAPRGVMTGGPGEGPGPEPEVPLGQLALDPLRQAIGYGPV